MVLQLMCGWITLSLKDAINVLDAVKSGLERENRLDDYGEFLDIIRDFTYKRLVACLIPPPVNIELILAGRIHIGMITCIC